MTASRVETAVVLERSRRWVLATVSALGLAVALLLDLRAAPAAVAVAVLVAGLQQGLP
jgi:hypothetical protein